LGHVVKQVTKAQLKESGDSEFLAAAGLVVNAGVWHRKCVRVNTKNVYQQQKFNLLREESEGYAKVLTALNRVGAAAVSEKSAPGLVRLAIALCHQLT
jgi:THO complex subunit 2